MIRKNSQDEKYILLPAIFCTGAKVISGCFRQMGRSADKGNLPILTGEMI